MRHRLTEPTTLTMEFWRAASVRKLVVPRCNLTGRYFFPPERCVPGTVSTDWSYVESRGDGAVYTYSVVYRAPSPLFDVPFVLAVVDLDEGWHMLTNIVGCDPETVHVGMRVTVTFIDAEGGALPVFTPTLDC